MQVLLSADWWSSLGGAKQIFWSVAILSSLMLFIHLVLHLIGEGLENEKEQGGQKHKPDVFDTMGLLVFFTFFGWTAVFASYLGLSDKNIMIWSLPAGLIAAVIQKLLAYFFPRPFWGGKFEAQNAVMTTGQVLKSIPPHRNGFGKVHLNLREAPFEMEAITAGRELPPGAPVRVVKVIDERVLLVELIKKDR